jgi:hypothetical protein
LELCLVDLGLRLDQVSLGLSLGVGNGETGRADTLVLSLKFPKILVDFLVLDLRVDLQALKHAVGLLLQTHGLVLGCGFLGAGLNLKSHVD